MLGDEAQENRVLVTLGSFCKVVSVLLSLSGLFELLRTELVLSDERGAKRKKGGYNRISIYKTTEQPERETLISQ